MWIFLDGSYRRSFRQGYTSPPGRTRVISDSPLHLGTEKHFRRFRRDRPRLDSLEWRGGDRDQLARPPSITSPGDGSSRLTLHSTHYRHEDSCSTCSSSSDSEEEGFFLGQRIPLPPQLLGERERGEERVETEVKSKRGSLRRRRTQSLSVKDKDKDKNCILSWEEKVALIPAFMQEVKCQVFYWIEETSAVKVPDFPAQTHLSINLVKWVCNRTATNDLINQLFIRWKLTYA